MNPIRDLSQPQTPAEREQRHLALLVEEVAADALERADTYPRETVVPEGGE